MLNFRTWLMVLLKGTGLLIVAGLCVAVMCVIFLLLTSRDFDIRVASVLGFEKTAARLKSAPQAPAPSVEETNVSEWNDHNAVVRRILECTGTESITNVKLLPYFVREMYTSNQRLLNAEPTPEKIPAGHRPPTSYERSYIELSRALANNRGQLTEKSKSAYSLWQITALITITLGMITTILVSLCQRAGPTPGATFTWDPYFPS